MFGFDLFSFYTQIANAEILCPNMYILICAYSSMDAGCKQLVGQLELAFFSDVFHYSKIRIKEVQIRLGHSLCQTSLQQFKSRGRAGTVPTFQK